MLAVDSCSFSFVCKLLKISILLLRYFGMHKFRILFLSIAIVLSRAQASTSSSSDNQRYDVRNTEINEGEMSFLLIRLKMQTQKGDTSQQGMPNPGKLISHLFILNTSTRLRQFIYFSRNSTKCNHLYFSWFIITFHRKMTSFHTYHDFL